VLRYNFLNPNQQRVSYSFKNNVFFVQKPNNFYNYSHFAEFIRATKNILDRPELIYLLENEKIYLSNRMFQKTDFVSVREVISTPVRGMFCKHINFFDLCRIYDTFLKNGCNMNSIFECPICDNDIIFNELIFLTEFVDIMAYILKKGFINKEKNMVFFNVDHKNKHLKLVIKIKTDKIE
jgi:hypothetical protein